MRYLVLYAYPPESDGLSIQGDLLYKGLLKNNLEAMPCHYDGGLQKEWAYKNFKPDVAIGVGYWGHTPQLILHPQQYNVQPVPWLLADGWVANYHDIIGSLPLVFATSNWVKEMYKRDGVETKNFEVMPIGCDINMFRPMSKNEEGVRKIRESLGIKQNEKMILTVGGDVTSKGSQEMLRALAKVDENFKDWKYVCKTWPSDSARDHHREELKLIKDLNLDEDRIIFLEGCFSREFMPYLLNAADIYAAPSRLEGFGMIQLEAQACGVPVISIDAMGCKDTIVHNKTGFLARVAEEVKLNEEWVYPWMGFPQKMIIKFDEPKTFAVRADVDELADFTMRLLTDDKLKEKISKNARDHVVKNFYYVDLIKKMTSIIEKRLEIIKNRNFLF